MGQRMANGILLLTTGIVLFLFSMMKLSAQMQGLFTARIRGYIKYAVRKPFYGLLTGMVSTITLQSSSAATVLIIGMVSAGLISFYHSLGMILGADIGTTITVQLVVWKVTALSPFFIIIGGTLWLTGKAKQASVGEAVFYFGLLFFGLSLTASATAPLRDDPAVIRFLQETRNPFWGLGVGIIITGLIHASAIPISILVILAQHGLISLDNAFPVVIGANIGTTVTALMAGAVSSGISGKRSALAHLIFKFSGALISLILLPFFIALLRLLSNNVGQQIALGHFLFNLLIVAVFIFLLKPFSTQIERRMPGKDDVLPLWPEHLDKSCLINAKDALGCVNRELARQIALTKKMYLELRELNEAYQVGKHQNVRYIAWVVEHLQREIVKYLRTISAYELSPELSKKLFSFTGMSDDVSRIGDQIVIIADLLRDKAERRLDFSSEAKSEMQEIAELVAKNLDYAVELLETLNGEKSGAVYRLEEEIDAKVKAAKEGHLVRFCEKVCQAEAGPIFVEILIHLERISDHCQNIGEYIADLK